MTSGGNSIARGRDPGDETPEAAVIPGEWERICYAARDLIEKSVVHPEHPHFRIVNILWVEQLRIALNSAGVSLEEGQVGDDD